MRRSAAPSRNQHGIKRQRILSDNLGNENSSAIICKESTSNEQCFDKENNSKPAQPKFIPQFKPKISSFRTPVRNTSLIPVQTEANEKEENNNSSNDASHYYNVMW